MQPVLAALLSAALQLTIGAEDACKNFDGIAAIQVEVVQLLSSEPTSLPGSVWRGTQAVRANESLGAVPYPLIKKAGPLPRPHKRALPNPVNQGSAKKPWDVAPEDIIHTRGHFNSLVVILIFVTLATLSVSAYCCVLVYFHHEDPNASATVQQEEALSDKKLRQAVAKVKAAKRESSRASLGSRSSMKFSNDDLLEAPLSPSARTSRASLDEAQQDEPDLDRRRSDQPQSLRKVSLDPRVFKERRSTWSNTVKAYGQERWSPEEGEETMSAFAFVVNIVADLCPSGFLSLSYGMDGTGYLWTVVIMILFYALCVYTMWCCGRTCEVSGQRNFSSQWALVIGAQGSWIPLLVIIIVAFGALLCYACYFGDLLEEVMPALGLHVPRYACLICFSLFPALPLCLLKNLSALAYTSCVAVVALIYTAVVMIVRLHDGSYAEGGAFYGDLREDLLPNLPDGQYLVNIGGRSLLFVNILAMAFHCHCNACKYYRELKDTTPRRFRNMTIVAMGIALVLYATIALVGFKTFGLAANGTILKNYSLEDMPVNVARVLISLSLVASYAIMFSALREALIGLLKHTCPPSFAASFDLVWRQDVLSGILVGLVTLCGVVSKDSGLVDGFVGAFCGNAIIYIIPCLLYTATVTTFLDKKRNRSTIVFSSLLVGLGVLLAVAGCICMVVFEVEAEPERPVQHHWKPPHKITGLPVVKHMLDRFHNATHNVTTPNATDWSSGLTTFGTRPAGRHMWAMR